MRGGDINSTKEVIIELTLLRCNVLSKLNLLSLKGDNTFTADVFKNFKDKTCDYLNYLEILINDLSNKNILRMTEKCKHEYFCDTEFAAIKKSVNLTSSHPTSKSK